MIIDIGIVAGEIWQHLDKNGSATLSQIVEATGRPKELVLMSLGWLGREGHVLLGGPATDYAASLVSKKSS